MALYDDIDTHRDLAKNRQVTLDDGSLVLIKQTDPYGYWSIHYTKGRAPQLGSFTSFEKALNALKAHLRSFSLPKKVAQIDKGYNIVTTEDPQVLLKA